MIKIRIRNFGPINDSQWIDIKKTSIFIGEQGSGKSTIAKLISIFTWIEKDIYRSDEASTKGRRWLSFIKRMLEYHRIYDYRRENSCIEYVGIAYTITLNFSSSQNFVKFDKSPTIQDYKIPKITYFPSERNYVSSIKKVKNGLNLKIYSESLQEFKDIFQEAKDSLEDKQVIDLMIDNTKLEYNKLNGSLHIKGPDYKINLTDASSGFQSLTPMMLVLYYVNNMLFNSSIGLSDDEKNIIKKRVEQLRNSNLDDEQVQAIISELYAKLNVKSMVNIIEEPEQNLYPSSQKSVLYKLLEYNNTCDENLLIVTTHSPYILGYITLAIKAFTLGEKSSSIVSNLSAIPIEETCIYEVSKGKVLSLDVVNGLPKDDDILNLALANINDEFDKLLELQNA